MWAFGAPMPYEDYEEESSSNDHDSDEESRDSGSDEESEDSDEDERQEEDEQPEENPRKKVKTEHPKGSTSGSSAAPARPKTHRRPQPPKDYEGKIEPNPTPWPKKILKALDKLVGKYEDPEGSVYVVLHSFGGGYEGGQDEKSFDLLGVFRSFESANVKVMEHVWQHYSDELGSENVTNATARNYDGDHNGALLWSIKPKDGSLTVEGLSTAWGNFKVWAEKKEIEA